MSMFDIKNSIKNKVQELKDKKDSKEEAKPDKNMDKPPTPPPKGRLQQVEKEMTADQEPEVAEATKPNNQPTKDLTLELTSEEKGEMTNIFKDKYDQTKKGLGKELETIDLEITERLKIIKKEFSKRVEEVQNEHNHKRTEVKDKYETKLNRYNKLMTKLGSNPTTEEILNEPLKEVDSSKPAEELSKKFEVEEPELMPVTEEDKRLGMEINDFIAGLKK